MNEPNEQPAAATLPVEPDTLRPDPLESLRHPAYFGNQPEPMTQAAPDVMPSTPQSVARTQVPAKRSIVPLLIGAAALLILGAAAGLIFSGHLGGKKNREPTMTVPFAVELGEPIPAFRGYLLDPAERGPLYTKDDTVGRPLVIAVWSAGDPETIAFLRAVTNLTSNEAYADTTILGINLDAEKQPAIDALIDTGAFAWPHLYNADDRLTVDARPATVLNISKTPAVYYVDALGRLRVATDDPDALDQLD